MKNACHEALLDVLAAHLHVDPLAIEGRQLLDEDWGMDSLDLVMIALRLEDLLAIDIAGHALDAVRTVAEFEAVVRRAPFAQGAELDLGATSSPVLRERVRRAPRRVFRTASRAQRSTEKRNAPRRTRGGDKPRRGATCD